ncbi:DUF7573 domain-containing protein [Haloarchaeobius baliensis]|uniref:DUF7573 domain-containing protein n=1 Tax=Haloarchaeobius baliensis TaxID=1670458 RepID=UPI003F881358
MTRDASLGEFGVGEDDEQSTVEPAESPTDADGAAAGSTAGGDHDAPDPIQPTSRWSGEPRPCADCGTDIKRAWTDDGRLLCADCKEW